VLKKRSYSQPIQHFSTNKGHEITIVSNGKEVLKHLETQKYDILMTNLLLQNYSGFEIINQFSELAK